MCVETQRPRTEGSILMTLERERKSEKREREKAMCRDERMHKASVT